MSVPESQRCSEALEQLLKSKKHLREHSSETSNIKVENCVGFVKVPVGIAGPLLVNGPNTSNERVYAPLATTEATLVASCSRGCKAFTACGGIQFDILGDNMVRAPCFKFATPKEAINFARQVHDIKDEISIAAESTSRHLRLQSIRPHVVGSIVHLYISYYCGDAAGQNMVTIASQNVCDMLTSTKLGSKFQIQEVLVENLMSSDKKPSSQTLAVPKGVEAMAWGTLTDSVCREILGVSSLRLYRGFLESKEAGTRCGMAGYSINTANVVAAMFIAAGQDAASIVDSFLSHVTVDYDYETKDLKVSVYFPCLPVGVIGGGTGYDTQRECLEILGCAGRGMKGRLAGLIASFALALDVSTISAILTHSFASSHQRLARPPPQKENQIDSKL
ncbi:hypothetical protein FQN54_003912 [Arachnomyces sp. PD_36]|nr:hypothetical protein FQN54_003912 [Arachnomyces sp. PD_36]